MSLNKRPLFVDDLINAKVGMIIPFDFLKEEHGAVSTSTSEISPKRLFNRLVWSRERRSAPENALSGSRGRERDSIMEGPRQVLSISSPLTKSAHLQAQGFVGVVAALSSMEQILLNVVPNSEQVAASCVGDRVHAIRTCNAPGDSSYSNMCGQKIIHMQRQGDEP